MSKEGNCIFCKIANKEISTNIVDEGEDYVAFNDLHPIAPVHVLLVPKKHISSISNLEKEDSSTMGNMIYAAKRIADGLGISEKGYKLLFRVGNHGGQEVMHIHLHLIGGARLHEDIRPVN